jgi:hypothetical protein
MLELVWFSTKLFFKGRLIRDPIYFVRQIGIGIIIGLLFFITLTQTEQSFWLTIFITSLVTGAIMPYLLKDFKMK